MNENISLKHIVKIGVILLLGGFIVTITGLFSYVDEKDFLSIIIMLGGVVITALGYALVSLFFHRDGYKKDEKTTHSNCAWYH